jgi:hypothetical protein
MRAYVLAAAVMFSLTVVACGGAPPAPPATPTAAPAAPPPAPTVPSAGECHGSLAKAAPNGWVEVGKIVVTTKDEMPTAYELRDLTGAKVDAGAITAKSARAAGDMVAQKICKVHGVLAIFEGKAGADGQLVMSVVRPLREDAPGDVAALCKEPPGLAASLDDGQKRRVAVDAYGQIITTSKWREWLFEMSAKLRKSDDAGRPAIMAANADVLEKAAKDAGVAAGACWFATMLKKP